MLLGYISCLLLQADLMNVSGPCRLELNPPPVDATHEVVDVSVGRDFLFRGPRWLVDYRGRTTVFLSHSFK